MARPQSNVLNQFLPSSATLVTNALLVPFKFTIPDDDEDDAADEGVDVADSKEDAHKDEEEDDAAVLTPTGC